MTTMATTKTWADESIFYHIYPLGFCGAEKENSFYGQIQSRLYKIEEQIGHLKNLGTDALYMGPVFESSAHGYDTADFFKIDSRLGTNDEFTAVCKKLKESGIKVVLDGVFNHVGRDFWAFKNVRKNKGHSPYVDWFYVKWDCSNRYNDGFDYEGWEGCSDLVKLNLRNPAVKNHIFAAIRYWVENFDIDGLRLDVAYCLDKEFLKELRTFCKALKADFWLMGETLHGDYNQWMNPQMLDSVTNYECYKGLFSSCNSKNLFEIAHSIKRQIGIYKGKNLYMFVDNHDVTRVFSILNDKRDLKLLYTMLFALPGVPSIYYGSEFALEGDKKHGDSALRPEGQHREYTDLTNHIKNLTGIYKSTKAMSLGEYREVKLTCEQYCFVREYESEGKRDKVVCTINISQNESSFDCEDLQVKMPAKSAQIFLNNECVSCEMG